MKFLEKVKLSQIVELTSAEIINGDANDIVTGINEIHFVEPGDLAFVDHPKYYEKALSSNASFIFIDKKVENHMGKTLLFCLNPFYAFNSVIKYFNPLNKQASCINKNFIKEENSTIFPNVFIGKNVKIGSNCTIHPNVVIYENTTIGDNVIIHANTTIGSDAFYYNKKEEKFSKFNSCGSVTIESDVEIGSGCTIDRGVTNNTLIGKGTKIDNQVHIGHDVTIGENCLIAAQCGIAGVTNIGNNSILWGQVGVGSNINLGDNTTILAKSGVSKSLQGDKNYFGIPAIESSKKLREMAKIRQLTKG